jgi:glycosyltransferase involved in cell wall biosynthesis
MPARLSARKPMRILIHDFGAYPFSAQLARSLADRGHGVRYAFAAGFKTPRAHPSNTDVGGRLSTAEIGIGEGYRPEAGLRRLGQERRYGRALGREIERYRPDVVVSANCPLDAQAAAMDATRAVRAAFAFWMQDLYSVAVRRLLARRLAVAGSIIGGRFERLERRLIREADAVVVIADGFRPVLERWGVATDRVHVIPNWAPLDEIVPGPKDNPWSRNHGLTEVSTLLYAGTLGRKHDPQLLVALAAGLPESSMIVVADGVGADRLRQTASLPLNLRLMPLQPASDVASMLASADILVALLDSDASAFSIPSKVLTYLAAGRPVLAAMPRDNEAARIVEAAAAGVVVDPSDRTAIVGAARRLLADGAARQAAGRNAAEYAREAFDADRKADEFEAVLNDVVLQSHSRATPRADTAAVTSEQAPPE